jgi:hypothetical protein
MTSWGRPGPCSAALTGGPLDALRRNSLEVEFGAAGADEEG